MALLQANSLLRVNQPCRVEFQGFVSDTLALGRCGWNISLETSRDPYHMQMLRTMMLYHKDSNTKAIAECEEFDTTRHYDMQLNGRSGDLPVFRVRHIAQDIRYMASAPVAFYKWVETRPSMIDMRMTEYNLEDLPLFMDKKQKVVQEIIVEPREVQDILNEIMQLQSPQQAEIRKKRLREEAATPMATILAFQA